jgi:hypothetical protein
VLPYLWSDKHEGFLFREVYSYGGMDKVRIIADTMFENTLPKEQGFGSFIVAVLAGLRTTTLAQCWSKCEGNSTLWQNRDVRIEVCREDISRLDHVEIYDVEYVDSLTIEDGLRRLNPAPIAGGGIHIDFNSVLLTKRRIYSDEYEVRILTSEGENVNRDGRGGFLFGEVFKQLYAQGKISKEELESRILKIGIIYFKKVSFAHIDNFIKSVMLKSSASKEDATKVERLCEKYSLKYLGRWQPRPL